MHRAWTICNSILIWVSDSSSWKTSTDNGDSFELSTPNKNCSAKYIYIYEVGTLIVMLYYIFFRHLSTRTEFYLTAFSCGRARTAHILSKSPDRKYIIQIYKLVASTYLYPTVGADT